MLTENQIYAHLFTKEWAPLIDFLHYHKKEIADDSRLVHISGIIEDEFIRNIGGYPSEDIEISIHLENFYLLHTGKFYTLKPESLETVYEELAIRMPTQYKGYSKENRDKAAAIQAAQAFREKEMPVVEPEVSDTPAKWTEIYNRLFEIMDVRNDAETYFSGPRFINLVRKYDRYHADYYQLIRQRELTGLSNTRKVYFEDVLRNLSNNNRKMVIDNILSAIRPFDRESVEHIEILLYGRVRAGKQVIEGKKKPIVFISYSWDDEEHKIWVINLANKLSKDGLDVKIDRQIMRLGTSANYTMEQSIEQADKVLVIFTPGYKTKADDRKGGVGYEYAILNMKLYNNQTVNDKIIPVLRRGNKDTSIPTFMQQFIHIDLRDDAAFESNYSDLRHELFL